MVDPVPFNVFRYRSSPHEAENTTNSLPAPSSPRKSTHLPLGSLRGGRSVSTGHFRRSGAVDLSLGDRQCSRRAREMARLTAGGGCSGAALRQTDIMRFPCCVSEIRMASAGRAPLPYLSARAAAPAPKASTRTRSRTCSPRNCVGMQRRGRLGKVAGADFECLSRLIWGNPRCDTVRSGARDGLRFHSALLVMLGLHVIIGLGRQ